MNSEEALRIIESHTFTSFGCTDPSAIALATATAFQAAGGTPLRIWVEMDRGIYKDALGVGIPGGFGTGLTVAAAAGLVTDPSKGLLLLDGVSGDQAEYAKSFAAEGNVTCSLRPDVVGILVDARVKTDRGVGRAIIRGLHDNVVMIAANEDIVFQRDHTIPEDRGTSNLEALRHLDSVAKLVDCVNGVDADSLQFLVRKADLNLKAARAGIETPYGLGVGFGLARLMDVSPSGFHGLLAEARASAAAAADTRMAGADFPIFGCFGSGNMGITFFTTVKVAGRRLGASDSRIGRALALGLLMTGMVKAHTSILTPHCGCALAAGVGAAGAVAYLLGGTPGQIEAAGLMIIANIFGVICDGAKASCALKIATASGTAIESAYLAVNEESVRGTAAGGIVRGSFAETLDAVEEVTVQGFESVDRSVVRLFERRQV